ncbi:hypothetical protein, partial [Apilactobacillus xinyiensis]|uniref:hypothetical protein n=1 Tax=Apilactobacillus xinyiensis TaxID=2841032 RepID=UPI0033651384
AANNGIKDAQSKPEGKASDYGYNDGTPAANAYNQAKANFDAGVNGKDKLANGSSADTKGTAYQAGAAANNGIKDAQSKPEGKASDYGYNDGTPAANAYNQAK